MKRPLTLPPLLGAQAVFMLGFSSVIPFLAAIANDKFGLDAAQIGIIVGLRIAVQQGMFVFGGLLSDFFGPRGLITIGCSVRALGFFTIALSDNLGVFLTGVALAGAAGALFSPALEASVFSCATHASARNRLGRLTPFAALALAGEIGGLLGALAGAIFIPTHMVTLVMLSGVLFALAAFALWRIIPPRSEFFRLHTTLHTGVQTSDSPSQQTAGSPLPQPIGSPSQQPSPVHSQSASLERAKPSRQGRRRISSESAAVIRLAAGATALLAGYTQLFSLIAVGLQWRELDTALIAYVSILLAVSTLLFQAPLSALAQAISAPRAVVAGLAVLILAGLAGAYSASSPTTWVFLAATLATTLLTATAMMLAGPAIQSLLAGTGSPRKRATRLGAYSSAAGLVAFGASSVTGSIANHSGLANAWLIAAAISCAGLLCASAQKIPSPLLIPSVTPLKGSK